MYRFDDTVETSNDLSKTRAGKAERGDDEARETGLDCAYVVWACDCKVEVKRTCIDTLFVGRVHLVRAVRGFPGRKTPILDIKP
jgi:hypothetical protein